MDVNDVGHPIAVQAVPKHRGPLMTSRPPKPRLALAIGITGHRPNRLPEAAQAKVRADIADQLRAIAKAAQDVRETYAGVFADEPPRLSLVCGLAEGADRMAAEAGLEQGYLLEALLPFSRDNFAADFETEESLATYRALLGRAQAVMEWPGRREQADRAYEAAGLALLDHSSLLIAIWDGAPGAGRGGTREIMEAAAQRGMPILVIDVTGETPPDVRWRDLDKHPRRQAAFDDLPAVPAAEKLTQVVEDVLRPPVDRPGSDHGEGAHLAAYLQSRHRKFHWRPEWHVLSFLAFVRRLRWSDLRSPAPEEVERQLKGVPKDLPRSIGAAFGWADAVAVHYAQIFRSAFVMNFLFAALSVFVVAASIFIRESLGIWKEDKWVFVLVEVVLILLVIINTRLGRRTNWHRRWLEAREVAERLRVAIPMFGLGCRPATGYGKIAIWTGWYGRAIIRATGLPSLALNAGAVGAGRQALLDMLHDQHIYHHDVHERMHRMEHRLERFGEVLFAATLVVAALYLATAFAHVHWEPWGYAVTAITAGLPVLATAAYGIRIIADFEGNAQRSARMSAQLKELIVALEGDDLTDLATAQDRAQQAAEIMLGDVANWRLTAEGRGLAIPG